MLRALLALVALGIFDCSSVLAQDAVFKIRNGALCATAFAIAPHLIVTNLHNLDGACRENVCTGISLESSAGNFFSSAADSPWQIHSVLPAFDLVALSNVQVELSQTLKISDAPLDQGADVSLRGFSGCVQMQESSGVVERTNAAHIYLSAKGSHGVSGSPLLDSHGQVAGVVDEAADLAQAALSELIGTSFELRAVGLTALKILLEKQASVDELGLMQRYYANHVAKLHGGARLFAALDFSAMVENRAAWEVQHLAPGDRSALLYATLGRYAPQAARAWPKFDGSELFLRTALMVTAYNLEQKGPFAKLARPASAQAFADVLHSPLGFPAEAANEQGHLISEMQAQGFPGVELYVIKFGAICILAFSVLALVLGLSLGWMYARMHGSVLRRLLIVATWGLLVWPFSVIIFLITKSDEPPR